MTVGVKLSSVKAEIYFNSNKIAAVIGNGGLGIEYPAVDASDRDGAAQGLGLAKLGEFTVNGHYLDGDTAQLAIEAKLGDDNSGAGYDLDVRPNGTGSGKSKRLGKGVLSKAIWTGTKDGMQTMDFTFIWLTPPANGTQT